MPGVAPRSALRRLWQRLPQNTRAKILFDVSRALAPRPDRAPRGGLPLAIAGPFSTASGIGEGARLAYATLDAAGMAPTAFDLSEAFGQVELHDAPARRAITPGSGGSLIVHQNGPGLPYALWALGRSRIRGRRIVGYWAWELPRLPRSWGPSFRYVHEIWVPSSFTRNAVAAATDLPVHVVPHPLPRQHATPNMRAQFGLPADALVVLTAFHLGSAFSRKNPLAAVAAFRRAFGEAKNRVLAIKLVDNGAAQARQQIEQAIAGAPNIRVIDAALAAADMRGLLSAADIALSLHRSEGFGLVPAEAMQLGKPVVATGWSGNLDFMNDRNSALVSYALVPVREADPTFDAGGQLWAEADIDHAADWLRRLAAEPALRSRLGAQAAQDVGAQLSPQRFVRTVTDLIAPGKAS
jgi:glycosyltransferase involved in cell wall biosynthesis